LIGYLHPLIFLSRFVLSKNKQVNDKCIYIEINKYFLRVHTQFYLHDSAKVNLIAVLRLWKLREEIQDCSIHFVNAAE